MDASISSRISLTAAANALHGMIDQAESLPTSRSGGPSPARAEARRRVEGASDVLRALLGLGDMTPEDVADLLETLGEES